MSQYLDHTFRSDDGRPPWVRGQSSAPCRPQTRWCDRVYQVFAFFSIMQDRPIPIFRRPVHLWNGFHLLRPGVSPQSLFQTLPHDGRSALPDTIRANKELPHLWIWNPPGLRSSRTLTHLIGLLPSTRYGLVRFPRCHPRYLIIFRSASRTLLKKSPWASQVPMLVV